MGQEKVNTQEEDCQCTDRGAISLQHNILKAEYHSHDFHRNKEEKRRNMNKLKGIHDKIM